MKKGIQILSITGEVLYESEKETTVGALEEAVSSHAHLSGANLFGANLSHANLSRAHLLGADLSGANLDVWWHVHHERLWEPLMEPIRNRIRYIKKEKLKHEIELRLKLLKPVLGDFPKDEKGWEELHKIECPNCPWNGETIFPDPPKEK